MKRMVVYILLLSLLLAGCDNKILNTESQFCPDIIPNCYELNRNILGEQTGRICKSGNVVAYSKYSYLHQNYSKSRTDGLYVCDEITGKKIKLADGIIFSIVIRDDGIYYLKRNEKGKIFLYNYDLYRYCFNSKKNELIIKDCSFVQFSEDAVFYCQQYLSDKEFYIEYKIPFDLKYEGKIIRHSLKTGEEIVVAETEGNIYNFLVTKNKVYFTTGEGNAFDGGRNIFSCDHNGMNLQQLTDNDNGYIKILYADDETGTILFYTEYKASDGQQGNSGYSFFDYKSSAIIWMYLDKDLPKEVYGKPVFYENCLYFCVLEDDGASNKILCLSPTGQQKVSLVQLEDVCVGLYVFSDKLHAVNVSNHLFETD